MSSSSIEFEYDALVLAHGNLPSKSCLRALAQASRRIVALDGAADRLSNAGFQPDFILGDLDSVSGFKLKSAAKRRISVVHMKEQETSDLEKGLRFCRRRRWKRVCIAGFLGPRLDHSLNALSVFPRYSDLEITLVTTQSIGRVVNGRASLSFTVKPGIQISVMPAPLARGVTLSGVKWPLRKRTLQQGGPVSLSNEAVAPVVTLHQISGCSTFIIERSRGQIALSREVAA